MLASSRLPFYWEYDDSRGCYVILSADDKIVCEVCDLDLVDARDNADYIVRACNQGVLFDV